MTDGINIIDRWILAANQKITLYSLKRKTIAEKVGWSPFYLSRVLNGEVIPSPKAEEKLTAAVDEEVAKCAKEDMGFPCVRTNCFGCCDGICAILIQPTKEQPCGFFKTQEEFEKGANL